jgi:exopolyphosphatase/guanosine-5'-triphosphate,3'-diphosphate pyrophosphatase
VSHVTVLIGEDTTLITVVSAADGSDELMLPCGMASLHERHITADPPYPEDLTNAIGEMIDHLDDARRQLAQLANVSTVVVGGQAAAAIAAVEYGGTPPAATFELSRDAAEDVFRTLATEATAERRHNPGLPADLVHTIVGGCCAMVAVFRALKLDQVTIVLEASLETAAANEGLHHGS